MARALLFAGLALIVLGIVFFAGIVPVPSSVAQSGLCVQSILQTQSVTICPGSQPTSVQGVQFGSTWMGSWSAPTQVGYSSASINVNYILLTGTTLSSLTTVYCSGQSNGVPCTPSTSMSLNIIGPDANGIGHATGSSPTLTLNVPFYFLTTIIDSAGTSASQQDAVMYVAGGYPIKFVVSDIVTNKPIANAQVQLYFPSGSSIVYGTQKTDSTGITVFNVPYGQYSSIVTASGYTTFQNQGIIAQNSPTVNVLLAQTNINVNQPVPVFILVKYSSGASLVPASGASVIIQFTNSTQATTGTTNGTGYASFTLKDFIGYKALVTYTGYTQSGPAPFAAATNEVVLVILGSSNPGSCTTNCPPPPSCVGIGTNAAVQVTVLDSVSSSPVKGAAISISGVGGGTAYTDANGSACLVGIAVPSGSILNGYTGSVSVSISAKGYTSQSVTVSVRGGQVSSTSVSLVASPTGFAFGNGQVIGGVSMAGGLALVFLGLRKRH